jgi:hypothetical protein
MNFFNLDKVISIFKIKYNKLFLIKYLILKFIN